MNNIFKNPVVFDAQEFSLSDYIYAKKNGTFEVELLSTFGTMTKNGESSFLTLEFLIKGTDEVLTVKELHTYTSKKKDSSGKYVTEVKESKSASILRAMIGFASGKDKATGRWSPVTKDVFGSSVDGHEMKSLHGKFFWITSQIERSVYTNKDDEIVAQESNTIRRVFSEDGLSLTEFKDAVESGTLGEYEPKVLEKAKSKVIKYKYRKCTEDEWSDISGSTDGNADGKGESTAPTTGLSTLPSISPDSLKQTTSTENDNVDSSTSVSQHVKSDDTATNDTAISLDTPTSSGGALPNLNGLTL